MPITPNNDRKTRQHHISKWTTPWPFKCCRRRRGVNRLDDPLNAPRAAGRKLCRSRKSDYLLPAVARVFRVRNA